MGYHCKDNWTGFVMIPFIVLEIQYQVIYTVQYQVIYNQSNLSFQNYFEEFSCDFELLLPDYVVKT